VPRRAQKRAGCATRARARTMERSSDTSEAPRSAPLPSLAAGRRGSNEARPVPSSEQACSPEARRPRSKRSSSPSSDCKCAAPTCGCRAAVWAGLSAQADWRGAALSCAAGRRTCSYVCATTGSAPSAARAPTGSTREGSRASRSASFAKHQTRRQKHAVQCDAATRKHAAHLLQLHGWSAQRRLRAQPVQHQEEELGGRYRPILHG
jgi:hypothetical protein